MLGRLKYTQLGHLFLSLVLSMLKLLLETYKSPGIDQFLEELIQAGGKILCSEIHTS
jgi:hypothetical protein